MDSRLSGGIFSTCNMFGTGVFILSLSKQQVSLLGWGGGRGSRQLDSVLGDELLEDVNQEKDVDKPALQAGIPWSAMFVC